MKRFTESTKWSKPWFRKLHPTIKLFWLYMLDNCDNSGVIDIDFELASFCIGEQVEKEQSIDLLKKQIFIMKCGKWFIKDFIDFQYGELSENCKPHKKVIDLLKKHKLFIGYTKGIYTLKEKEKEKEEEKEEEKENIIYIKFAHLKLTTAEFNKLNLDYSKDLIDETIEKIQNWKPNKKYKSLYITLKNWLKKEVAVIPKIAHTAGAIKETVSESKEDKIKALKKKMKPYEKNKVMEGRDRGAKANYLRLKEKLEELEK